MMDLAVNSNPPKTMFIDLNSAFATIEQQANHLLRGRPIAVAAYNSPGGCILAPSIEAKRYGVKVGMRVQEGKQLVKELLILTPDPDKYFHINRLFQKVILNYTDDFRPKSIDELVINFASSRRLNPLSMEETALNIKKDIKDKIGDWMTVNIGIATNTFLAKTAAGLHKPDGLDIITESNIREVLSRLELIDLCGINRGYMTRLKSDGGIFTPLQLLDAPYTVLRKQVFKGIVGHYWYCRIRGWEMDNVVFRRKSFGNDYALKQPTNNMNEINRLIMKLCDKSSRRLRQNGYAGWGMSIWLGFIDHTGWHQQRRSLRPLISTNDLFSHIEFILSGLKQFPPVSRMGITCFNISPYSPEQLSVFNDDVEKQKRIAKATDLISDKFGDFSLVPATMMNMEDTIIKRVPFGATAELD